MIPSVTIFIGIFKFWEKLPSPIKVLIYLFLAFACGYVYGTNKANQRCEMDKQASIAEAVRIDGAAKEQQIRNKEADADKYRKQSLDAENKLSEAATQFSKLAEQCNANQDFIDRNNADSDLGSGLSKPLPGRIKKSPVR